MKDKIKAYLKKEQDTIAKINLDDIEDFINILISARNANQTIFVMGNGGSASTASHMVNDFNKGCSYQKNTMPFKFICLNDSVSTIMAYANDVGYEHIFVEQLRNLMEPKDVVIGISGSGNSPNVINAIQWANDNMGVTVALTGFNGGRLHDIAQHEVNVPIDHMGIVEDVHMIFDHLIMDIVNSEDE